MADTLKLEIVTPESVIYSEDVEMVTLPGSEGETAGELVVKRCGAEEILAVGEGFAEITGDHVAILTDNAIDSANVDEAAAEEAKAKAEQRLEEGGDMTEDEAKALNQAILFSAAQLKAKRSRR